MNLRIHRCCVLLLFTLAPALCFAQTYNLFEIKSGDVYWRYQYNFNGPTDSLRHEVVQMLKSKFFTFNVIRNESGYNGELKHYKVDCKRYARNYYNTPRMYWYGEWTGKFVVEVIDNCYIVTVYALYAEKFQMTQYNPRQRMATGRYFETVTTKNRLAFKKSEYTNLDLLSLSLKDSFDIGNTVLPTGF